MGKKGKKMRSDAKKMKKKAEKARKKAYYESLRLSGDNRKSRSARKAKKRRGFGDKNKHLVNNCGNIGCQKCNPSDRKPEVLMTLKELLRKIKLSPANKQIPGGNQTKKNRGGKKAA